VFQIRFPTPTIFFQIFPCCLAIFPALESNFEFVLNQNSADVWDPPVSHSVAAHRALIGRSGGIGPLCRYKTPAFRQRLSEACRRLSAVSHHPRRHVLRLPAASPLSVPHASLHRSAARAVIEAPQSSCRLPAGFFELDLTMRFLRHVAALFPGIDGLTPLSPRLQVSRATSPPFFPKPANAST
jgi:hypothetical protein